MSAKAKYHSLSNPLSTRPSRDLVDKPGVIHYFVIYDNYSMEVLGIGLNFYYTLVLWFYPSRLECTPLLTDVHMGYVLQIVAACC
jgi:hypothetical protein